MQNESYEHFSLMDVVQKQEPQHCETCYFPQAVYVAEIDSYLCDECRDIATRNIKLIRDSYRYSDDV